MPRQSDAVLNAAQQEALVSIQRFVSQKATRMRADLARIGLVLTHQECVQELNLCLCKTFRRYDPALGAPTTFATRACAWAVNKLKVKFFQNQDQFEQFGIERYPSCQLEEIVEASEFPDTDSSEVWRLCRQELTEEQWRLVEEVFRQGRSKTEIGRRIGTSRETVSLRLGLALRVLQPVLEGAGYGLESDE